MDCFFSKKHIPGEKHSGEMILKPSFWITRYFTFMRSFVLLRINKVKV